MAGANLAINGGRPGAVGLSIGESRMDESIVATIVGSSALLIAAMMVVGHYRRERRRQRLIQHLDDACWWHSTRPWR
ncbi:hypothetical protein AWB81_06720 [Caballeronia arationis]|jgi:hypothetical protein|uniref:Uncharacterized protein n=2 Tax=Caballeronia arationis TaxID=1777142 RepID=A0A7Z7IEH8_9BURK|nr:hypothetical protein AWB81_06720 [Caballeronia arationis]SOE89396.1 hypothetical protein SAMN05446927_7978 [Caballeronia arationis]